jgi:hypothetical protein
MDGTTVTAEPKPAGAHVPIDNGDRQVSGQTAPERDRIETPETVTLDAGRQIRGLRFALGVAVLVAVTVILTAINVQSGRILDQEGHGWSFRALFGPGVFGGTNLQGWRVVSESGQLSDPEEYARLLRAFQLVDFALITVYFFLLRAVIATLGRGRWRSLAMWALLASVLFDAAENVLSIPGLLSRPGPVVVVATRLKWAALLLIVVFLVLSAVTRPLRQPDRSVLARFRRAVKAVMHQRFLFVPVIVLFVLSVPSGAPILEQLPDALRGWISSGTAGSRQAVVSMLCTLGLGTFLIMAGRYRTGYAYRHPKLDQAPPGLDQPPPPPEPGQKPKTANLLVWAVGPLVALGGALLVMLTGHQKDILWGRLAVFLLLPVGVILGGSLITRAVWKRKKKLYRPDEPPTFDERELSAVRLAGTIAGLAAITVGGLSLIRAYVPLVIVPRWSTLARPGPVWLFLLIGAGAVVAPWLIAMLVIHRVAARRCRTLDKVKTSELRTYRQPTVPVGSWVLLGSAMAVFVVLGVFPQVAAWVGLAGTATLALGSMAGMLAGVALLIQDRPTAEIFRVVGMKRSPLVTMLALSLVLVNLFGGRGTIHQVDPGSPATSPSETRLTMADSFDAWLHTPQPCSVKVGGRDVRPMLLIAAEGGGIRAAYWTVRGLQAIADKTCGEYSTLFSAGASGGSVGLTVARFSGTPTQPNTAGAVAAVKKMAEPGTLSRAADGTFVRDIVYGASGVPVQRYGEPDPYTWKDRARLIEDGWGDAEAGGDVDWGDLDFLTPSDQLGPSTGQLILNSTDVKNACRVWVSQVSPGLPVTQAGDPSFDPERSCDKTPGPGARTIDLFTAYGPFVPGADPKACLGRIRSATAALLTARFPYVTPSGVVGPCPAIRPVDGKALPYWPRTQLVDGGYIENSGIATITDLSDDWLSLVRDHNAAALAASGSKEPLVVPIVVFLANGDRRVVQPAIDSSPVSELAVPVLTYLRSGKSLSDNGALLERARSAVETGNFCPSSAAAVCSSLQSHFPSRVVVIDRVTQPEIGAPLGWVLSQASITSMDVAMERGQLQTQCANNAPRSGGSYAPVQADRESQPSCRTGYATLGDLVRYYNTPT